MKTEQASLWRKEVRVSAVIVLLSVIWITVPGLFFCAFSQTQYNPILQSPKDDVRVPGHEEQNFVWTIVTPPIIAYTLYFQRVTLGGSNEGSEVEVPINLGKVKGPGVHGEYWVTLPAPGAPTPLPLLNEILPSTGYYEWRLKAVHTIGYRESQKERFIKGAPIINREKVTVSPTKIKVGESVTFIVDVDAVIDPDASVSGNHLEYEWDFGDGNTISFMNLPYTVEHTYVKGGTLAATLIVRDVPPGGFDINKDVETRASWPIAVWPDTPIVFDFISDREDWTSHSVPIASTPPDFAWEPDYLKMTSSTNTNTFGCWQSPQDAVPADENYLYRARFNVSTDITNQAVVPLIRLRANSLNLQQYDVLSIESAGDGAASPAVTGKDYDLYFVPPANDTAAMLAFDLLNFNPDDAATAELSLDTVTVDRFALDSLSTPTVVQDYDFELSQDGWTTGGAPIVFTSPQYIYSAGALQLRATTNTNTFGFWGNHPADITIEADKLYRGMFEVRTDVTIPALVPEMRLRFNTENLQASRALGITSADDGANSPVADNTIYNQLYLLPPASCVGEGLIVSIDILNFDPYDDPTGNLVLDTVTIETIDIPEVP